MDIVELLSESLPRRCIAQCIGNSSLCFFSITLDISLSSSARLRVRSFLERHIPSSASIAKLDIIRVSFWSSRSVWNGS